MSENPQILVVLPTIGERIDSLRETLASIEEQRKSIDLTLVVVCPTEAKEAIELANQYSAKIVADPKTGISNAINIGIRERTGESYYAWMGDDDLFLPGSLPKLFGMINSSPDVVVAYGGCRYINPEGNEIATNQSGELAKLLLPWGPDLIPHPGSILRLDAMEEVGLFDPTLKYAMDLDMFLKLRKMGKFVSTKVLVSAFRWHPQSLTVANRTKSTLEAEFVKRKYLPAFLRFLSPIWHLPVRVAASLAAKRLNHIALTKYKES